MNRIALAFALASILLLASTGCEKPPEIGKVTGTVTMDGKPLDTVRVLFLPDPHAGNSGGHSECVTGEDGTYDLVYSLDPEVHGALVGWHKIIIEDTAAEEARGEFRPIRVPDDYSTAAKSPLKFEVQPGEQAFDFEVPKKR